MEHVVSHDRLFRFGEGTTGHQQFAIAHTKSPIASSSRSISIRSSIVTCRRCAVKEAQPLRSTAWTIRPYEGSFAVENSGGQRGDSGYIYTRAALLFDRARRVRRRKGSVTQLMTLSIPHDEISHHIPDLTDYVTENRLALERDLNRRGTNPSIDAVPSFRRLKTAGVGAGRTRYDHPGAADPRCAYLAWKRELRRLSSIVAESSLSELTRVKPDILIRHHHYQEDATDTL